MPTFNAEREIRDLKGDNYSVKMLGGIADGVRIFDGAITSGSAILHSPSNPFTPPDVTINDPGNALPGMIISVAGAGTAGASLITTIVSFTDTGHIVLAVSATTTVTASQVIWGSDNTAAFQAALATRDRYAQRALCVNVPAGIYCVTDTITLKSGAMLRGQGRGATMIAYLANTGACVSVEDTVQAIIFEIRNLSLITNSIATNTAVGLKILGGQSGQIDCLIDGFETGMWITGDDNNRYSNDLWFHAPEIHNFTKIGFWCEFSTGVHVLHGICRTPDWNVAEAWGLLFDTGTSGIYIDQWDLEFCGCKIQSTKGTRNPVGYPPQFFYFTRVVADSCPTHGIWLDKSLDADSYPRAAIQLHFIDCWAAYAFQPGHDGLLIEGGQDISWTCGRIRVNSRYGVHVTGGLQIRFVNAYIAGNNLDNAADGAGIFIESVGKEWVISAGTLISIVVSGGVATATTSTAHGLASGELVRVFSSPTTDLNVRAAIIATPTTTTFTFPVPAADGTYTDTDTGITTGQSTGTVEIIGGMMGDHISGDGRGYQDYGVYIHASYIAPFVISTPRWLGNRTSGFRNDSGTTYQTIITQPDASITPAQNSKNRLWFNNGRLEIGDGGFVFSFNELGTDTVGIEFDKNTYIKNVRNTSNIDVVTGTSSTPLAINDGSLISLVCTSSTITFTTRDAQGFSLGQPVEFTNWWSHAGLITPVPTTRKITAIISSTQYECINDSGLTGTFTDAGGEILVRCGVVTMISDLEVQQLHTFNISGLNTPPTPGFDLATPAALIWNGLRIVYLLVPGQNTPVKVSSAGDIISGAIELLNPKEVTLGGAIADGHPLIAMGDAIADGGAGGSGSFSGTYIEGDVPISNGTDFIPADTLNRAKAHFGLNGLLDMNLIESGDSSGGVFQGTGDPGPNPAVGGFGTWQTFNCYFVGDRDFTDAAATSGGHTITITSNGSAPRPGFSSSDIGKTIVVNGAGSAGGEFVSIIDSITSSTVVHVVDAIGTTVSSANCHYGGWIQVIGSNISLAFTVNFNNNFSFYHAAAGGFDNTIIQLTKIHEITDTGVVVLKHGSQILEGTGDPESSVTAPAGSLYLRYGGSTPTLYTKASGSGNTGWISTAPPFVDTTELVFNTSDDTKIVKLDAQFLTTGTTRTIYMGDADVTLSNSVHVVSASFSTVILTTSYQVISGVELVLTKKGWWRVEVSLMCSMDYQDTSLTAELIVNGTPDSRIMEMYTSVGNNVIVTQSSSFWWVNSTTGGEVLQIFGKKSGGSGSSAMGSVGVAGGQSVLDATWVHF